MGGRGSGRWHGHQKAALVENAIAIDMVVLGRAGVLAVVGKRLDMTWTVAETIVARGSATVVTTMDGYRYLDVVIELPGIYKPIVDHLQLTQRARRRLLVCPGCELTFAKVYVVPGRTVGECLWRCRFCARLSYLSAQTHDTRRDEALRDPAGFAEARRPLGDRWSRVVTWRLAHDALTRKLAPRRGRGFGRKSQTSLTRARAELAVEFERKWGRPLPTIGKVRTDNNR